MAELRKPRDQLDEQIAPRAGAEARRHNGKSGAHHRAVDEDPCQQIRAQER